MVELKDQTSSFEGEDGIYGAYHITVVIEENLLFVNIFAIFSLFFFPGAIVPTLLRTSKPW